MISINGVQIGGSVSGSIISVGNNQIFVNGKKITGEYSGIVEIKIIGDILNIESDAPVTVVGTVKGNVKTKGSVNCENIGGNVIAGGSVNCNNISGDCNAGGSINRG